MNIQIKTVSHVIGAGSGQGDYKVPLNQKQTFDIGDNFQVPQTWTLHSTWYQVTDALSDCSKFRGVDVGVASNDVLLTLFGGAQDAQTRITVFALYFTP